MFCITSHVVHSLLRWFVSDGLHIRWRETAPDRGLLTYALSQIDALHTAWPETLQCNIVIERAPLTDAARPEFHADVELDLGRRSPRVRVRAQSEDVYKAVRIAFRGIREMMPTHGTVETSYTASEVAA